MNSAFLYTIVYTAIMDCYLKNILVLILLFMIILNSLATSNITMSVEIHIKTALKSHLIPENGLFARTSDNGERVVFFPQFSICGLPSYMLTILLRLPDDTMHILVRDGNAAFLTIPAARPFPPLRLLFLALIRAPS